MKTSAPTVDFDHPEHNGFGCPDCPKCKGYNRYWYYTMPRVNGAKYKNAQLWVKCDDCGFVEKGKGVR